jgi:hypothetical protein
MLDIRAATGMGGLAVVTAVLLLTQIVTRLPLTLAS